MNTTYRFLLVPGNLILISNAEAGLLLNRLQKTPAGGPAGLINPAGRNMQEQTQNYIHHFNLFEQDEVVN